MSSRDNETHVCPVEIAGSLDNKLRRWLQNPRKIVEPYIKKGMTVLDLGCGPGFCSIELATLLQGNGLVIAADLQEAMLEKVNKKIAGTTLEQRIRLHRCSVDKIGLEEKVDFVLAFYVIHEIPDQERLFLELKTILKPEGKILIVEPNFHVTKKAFGEMLVKIKNAGFKVIDGPKMFLSRTVVLGK